MNIGEAYSTVLQMNPLVPFSPNDFQLQFNVAEEKLYEELYGAIYKQQQGRPPIAYQVTQSITDALQPFTSQYIPPINPFGAYALPVDYRHGTAVNVLINGVETETMTLPIDKWQKAARSKLVPVSENPISKYEVNKFWVLPKTNLPVLHYLKKPILAVFGYTEVNGYVEYDASASTQTMFPEFVHLLLIYYTAKGLGVSNESWNAISYFNTQLQVMG